MDETTKPRPDSVPPKVPAPGPVREPAPSLDPIAAGFSIPDEAFKDAVEHDPTEHQKARNAHYSCAWIEGPGAVTLLVEAARGLFEVAALRGEPTTEIEFVHPLALSSSNTLVMWPTHDKDPKKVRVSWQEGAVEFSASKVLRSAKMALETRKKCRFEAHVVAESKVGPVLAIDMSFELETKLLPKRKSYSRAKGKKKAAKSKESPAAQTEGQE